MNAKGLEELAGKCEAAVGPDREIDALIWCALRGVRYQDHHKAYASYGADNPETQVEFTEPSKRTLCVSTGTHTPHAKPVTASIDAALSLVPEGWGWRACRRNSGDWGEALVWDSAERGKGSAATPALALCAAACRALANQEKNDAALCSKCTKRECR